VLGPSVARAEVPAVVEKLIQFYLRARDSEVERFVDVVHRLGVAPFKEAVYGNADQRSQSRRERVAA
jgi:sulfite reductase (NADPH) hemoprotein beta-component